MAKNEYVIGSNPDINRKDGGMPGPGGMRGGERAKNFKGTWAKLLSYMKPYLPAIVTAVIIAAIGTVLNLVGPERISRVTDMITAGLTGAMDLDGIVEIALLLGALYILGFALNYMQGFMMASVTQKVSKRMRTDISEKINRLPLQYFDRNSYGDVLSRVTNDVDTIAQTLNQSIGGLVSAVAMFLGSLIMMLSINAIMTVAAVLSAVLGFLLMQVIMRRSQKYFTRQQQDLGAVNGHIEETYAGHAVVKAYNGEGAARAALAAINDRLYDSAWKSQFLSGLMPTIMSFVGNLGYVAVCITGAVLAINGTISFGVIVAFMLYIRLFTQPLSQLAQAATNLQSTAAAGERVFDFLAEEELAPEGEDKMALQDVRGDIAFENVVFSYSADKPIINGVSFEARAGQKIAIVGPTGAGKTTIVNLLMRFYELSGGDIKIDGVPIADMSRAKVHSLFCMVLQDTWLFNGTIKENIVFNKEGVSDEQVVEAAKAANIHHFITTLPEGYDTVLGDDAGLSAGQRQLITIARAMVENAPMLILDEATSNVDTRTEVLIQDAMDRLMKGRTSIVIAHRLSTIKNANTILVMQKGRIVESGTHDELMERKGAYRELYESQFEGN